MRRLSSPSLRITMGLVSLTISLVFVACALGLVPDESKAALEARAKVSEALAFQLAAAASRNDITTIKETIASVVKHNPDVLSLALRSADRNILVEAGDHATHWVESQDGRSTSTHVQVPLVNADSTAGGKIEIAFRPLSVGGKVFGLPTALLGFVAYLSVAGFIGYFLLLRRALRELDPSGVIPERVQAAFDALAEGVLIVDEREIVLLANNAFAETINKTSKSLFGTKAGDLPWRQWSGAGVPADFPWRLTMRDGKSLKGVSMGLRTATGDMHSFMVNATRIVDGKGIVRGAIATFDDVSALEHQNEKLNHAVRQLRSSQAEIDRQNQELRFVASHDSLTGCLNRRALFTAFEVCLKQARSANQPLSCLMVDLDHFKSINDRFGHAAGDTVLVGMADLLKSICREQNLVSRYGGEEFCIVLDSLNEEDSWQIAERILKDMTTRSPGWSTSGVPVTASIGVATLPDEPCTAMDLVKRADAALYAAKAAGRNRVVRWENQSPEAQDPLTPTRRHSDCTDQAASGISDAPDAASPLRPKPSVDLPMFADQSVDPSTHLPTRVIFFDRVNQSIVRAERSHKIVAVLHVTVDTYRRLNEAFGSGTGLELVRTVAARLSAVVRRSDTVSLIGNGDRLPTISRLATDTFAIEVADLEGIDSLTWIIKRIFDGLRRPIRINGQETYVNCCMGVGVYPGDGADAETLVRHASAAERQARESLGPNSHMFYSHEINERSRREVMLEAAIRHAVEHNQMSLLYQPIVDLQTGRVTSAEVLLQFEHEDLKAIPVRTLISLAEQYGLISGIGEWVLQTSTRQFRQWIDDGLELARISVNLSAVQLRDPAAIERLLEMVQTAGFAPSMLQVEITETALLQDIEAAGDSLKRIQQLGVQVALDDFGTGYSSLTHLRRFRPDVLKIDRSFIDEIGNSRNDATVVWAVIAMAKAMGLRIVAEGVETAVQMVCLRDLQCNEVQGYLVSRPMSASAMSDWLRSSASKDLLEPARTRQSKTSAALALWDFDDDTKIVSLPSSLRRAQ